MRRKKSLVGDRLWDRGSTTFKERVKMGNKAYEGTVGGEDSKSVSKKREWGRCLYVRREMVTGRTEVGNNGKAVSHTSSSVLLGKKWGLVRNSLPPRKRQVTGR